MSITLEAYQKRIANVSIGASTLRNHPVGTIPVARKYLSRISLEDFREIDKGTFKNLLDRHTLRLQGQIRKLDNSAFYWGSARKAINIFLATACYHAVLRREYDLDKIEDYMEIPLDSQVAKKLSTEAKKREIALSQWESLKHLPKNLSEEYQKFALLYAQELKCSRVQLDVLIWRAVNECERQAQTRRA